MIGSRWFQSGVYIGKTVISSFCGMGFMKDVFFWVELDFKRSEHSQVIDVDRWSAMATVSCCQSWVLVIEVNEILPFERLMTLLSFRVGDSLFLLRIRARWSLHGSISYINQKHLKQECFIGDFFTFLIPNRLVNTFFNSKVQSHWFW